MTDAETTFEEKRFLNRTLEAAIRIGLVALLVAWCFEIVRPFIGALVWGIIIAVATFPAFCRLLKRLGERHGLAAGVFTLVALLVLIIPTVMLGGTLVDGAQILASYLNDGSLTIPPPSPKVATWPLIGPQVSEFWSLASENLSAALIRLEPQLKAAGGFLLSGAAGVGLGILQFVFAIVIAGVLLAHATSGGQSARAVATRLMGERGPEFANLAQRTVRSVARGILGVALIQSILAGLGFLAIGLPGAGLLALACLLLSVVQIGVAPVVIPAVIYVFSVSDTLPAVVFLIWSIFVLLLDNILKPILLGRGAPVPMVVIFIGAIGGFLSSGIIGLFVGSVILALGYTLFLTWLTGEPPRQFRAKAAFENDEPSSTENTNN